MDSKPDEFRGAISCRDLFSSVADCLFGLGAGDAQQLLHTAAARAQILGPVTSAFAHSKALLDMV